LSMEREILTSGRGEKRGQRLAVGRSNLRAGQVKLPQKVLIQTPEARGQELSRQPDYIYFNFCQYGDRIASKETVTERVMVERQ